MKKKLIITVSSLLLFACSKSQGGYGLEEAIDRGDVVYQSKVHNFNVFQNFLKKVEQKEEDQIRITAYTKEGDPIFQDLKFDGKTIHYVYDDSNDQYGGSTKKVREDCTKIIEKENGQDSVDYFVSGCPNNKEHFLINVEKSKIGD